MEHKTVEALVSVGERYVGRVPGFDVEPGWWPEVEAITQHLDALLGVRTFVLRLLHADEAEIGRGGRVVYHVQALAQPRSGVLDPTPVPEWDSIVAPHPLRATWAEVNGPSRLIEWAQSILGPRDGVQVKTWNLSCLIRFPGAWAKATSRFCGVDADVVEQVRRYDEKLAPAVLGRSMENRWSLLAHAPGIDCWEPDPETIDDVVRRWVAVQAQLAGEDLAVPRLVPEELAGLLPEADLAPLIAELESSGLPITLVHGDFHPGNWRSDGTNRVIVDWADAFVGQPALDVKRLLDFVPASKHAHITDVWCDAWRQELPGCEPHRAIQPLRVLGPLTYARTYQRFLDSIEPDERVYHQDDPAICRREALSVLAEL